MMTTPLLLQSSCSDWQRDSTGGKVYYPPSTLKTSCCNQVRITPAVIELTPNEERDVLVTVRYDGANNDGIIRTGMLFLTQANDPKSSHINSTHISIRVQIGVMIYLLPREIGPPAIAITGMSLNRKDGQYRVRVNVHNKGQSLLESQLRLEYLNLETREEEKPEPIPVNTMPNDFYSVFAPVPGKLPTGKYLIVAILDSGTSQTLKVAELETVLK